VKLCSALGILVWLCTACTIEAGHRPDLPVAEEWQDPKFTAFVTQRLDSATNSLTLADNVLSTIYGKIFSADNMPQSNGIGLTAAVLKELVLARKARITSFFQSDGCFIAESPLAKALIAADFVYVFVCKTTGENSRPDYDFDLSIAIARDNGVAQYRIGELSSKSIGVAHLDLSEIEKFFDEQRQLPDETGKTFALTGEFELTDHEGSPHVMVRQAIAQNAPMMLHLEDLQISGSSFSRLTGINSLAFVEEADGTSRKITINYVLEKNGAGISDIQSDIDDRSAPPAPELPPKVDHE
jgi:hypothetical protein